MQVLVHGTLASQDQEKEPGRVKTCTKCEQEKPLSDFYKHSGFPDGYRSRCKGCHVKKSEEWRKANPDKINALNKKYYYQDPLKRSKITLTWMKNNPDKCCDNSHRYRARKKNAFVENVSSLVVLELDDGICGICGKDVDPFDYHVDHVVPLSRGGDHSYANVQLSHPICNWKKGTN